MIKGTLHGLFAFLSFIGFLILGIFGVLSVLAGIGTFTAIGLVVTIPLAVAGLIIFVFFLIFAKVFKRR